MPSLHVSSLITYPLKSGAPIYLDHTQATQRGLPLDREFMVTRPDGDFATGRSLPKLPQVQATVEDKVLTLSALGEPPVHVSVDQLRDEYFPTHVFGTKLNGQLCSEAADRWLSDFLGEHVHLVYFGPQTKRFVKRSPETPVTFADGYPMLIIGEASLQDLNNRLPGPITMQHFRPNVTFSGGDAFQEDGWSKIRIGEVTFSLPQPCSRCVFTTVSPSASQRDALGEPLQTLSRYRRDPDSGKVMFGENMIPLNEGQIRIGDEVEILETKTPPIYPVKSPMPPTRTQNHLTPSLPQSWNGTLRCVRVVEETHDVKSFHFTADPFQRFAFQPGQFVNLELPIGGNVVHRCYTIATSPTRPDLIGVTIKRKPGGLASNWIHDHVSVGTSLKAHGPSGVFHLADQSKGKLLLISGGVGITPMLSMARFIADTATHHDVVFHHSAKTNADLVLWDELQVLARTAPNIRLSANIADEAPDPALPHPTFQGFVTKEVLSFIAPDISERDVFCCGPAPFMEAVKRHLLELGLPEANYHEEAFDFTPATAEIADTATSHTITFSESGKSYDTVPGQTVLEAAEAAGIDAPYGCRGGVCGGCISKLVSGDIDSPANEIITEEEAAEGMFLTCCSIAKSDLVVEL